MGNFAFSRLKRTVLGKTMQKKQLKPILPSLRERKRYLAFKINSKRKINDFSAVKQEIMLSSSYLLGDIGMAKASITILKEKRLIMVGHKYLEHLRAALALIKSIAGIPVMVQSLGASGTVRGAEKYLA